MFLFSTALRFILRFSHSMGIRASLPAEKRQGLAADHVEWRFTKYGNNFTYF
jgi:hypothetical protein